jgi:hypothetical protein
MIPGISSAVQAIANGWFNAKVQMYAARVGGDVDVAKTMLMAEVQTNQTKVSWLMAIASNPVLLFIVLGFSLPLIIFEWKCIVYDIVWMHGTTSTDPIRGQLADWATVILSGIFVTSTGIGVAHTWINRK